MQEMLESLAPFLFSLMIFALQVFSVSSFLCHTEKMRDAETPANV